MNNYARNSREVWREKVQHQPFLTLEGDRDERPALCSIRLIWREEYIAAH